MPFNKHLIVSGNKTTHIPPSQALEAGSGPGFFEATDLPVVQLSDAATEWASVLWRTPSNFNSLTSIKALWVSSVTGNAYLTFRSWAAAAGENILTSVSDTDSIAATTYAGTANNLIESDVTAMANGLTIGANHTINLTFERQGANASDSLNGVALLFVGFLFNYA